LIVEYDDVLARNRSAEARIYREMIARDQENASLF